MTHVKEYHPLCSILYVQLSWVHLVGRWTCGRRRHKKWDGNEAEHHGWICGRRTWHMEIIYILCFQNMSLDFRWLLLLLSLPPPPPDLMRKLLVRWAFELSLPGCRSWCCLPSNIGTVVIYQSNGREDNNVQEEVTGRQTDRLPKKVNAQCETLSSGFYFVARSSWSVRCYVVDEECPIYCTKPRRNVSLPLSLSQGLWNHIYTTRDMAGDKEKAITMENREKIPPFDIPSGEEWQTEVRTTNMCTMYSALGSSHFLHETVTEISGFGHPSSSLVLLRKDYGNGKWGPSEW